LAVSRTGVWVGTQHGLMHIRDGQARQVLTGPRVGRVIVMGDSVWAATTRGLLVAAIADADTTGGSWREAEGLGPGVYIDVARLGSRTFALSPEGFYAHTERTWRGPVRTPAMNGLGRLRRLLAADSALWIAGERGVARYDPTREAWLYFLAPGDIPEGPIADLAIDGAFVWLATPAGALRLQWRAR
jgi:ligand-binding sensor domain-containing protein